MDFKDGLGFVGHFHGELIGSNGEVKQVVDIHNTLTELFDAHVADTLSDGGESAIGYMGVGTGTGQGSSDTGLATALARVALDSTTQGTTTDDNDVIYVATFPAGTGTGALTEAGIMQADNNTTMMAYTSFDVINKGASDSFVVTWTITCGAS
jgi:hypothetical protein